ncbi:MAG: glycosyltransferase family 1 protein [Candidatus Omnitrophica bacterium]|nr:glycosyltransferase family 1 protein [Candidatus Omnitrophota bacterium]
MMKLCLFLTYGMSLERWDQLGILERELALYEKLAGLGVRISLFTYGNQKDLSYETRFPSFKIFPAYADLRKPSSRVVRFFQSLGFAKRYKTFFEEHDLFKTNQLWGVWIPLQVQKMLKKPLIFRAGYEAYLFAILGKSPRLVKVVTYFFSRKAYRQASAVIFSSHSAKQFAERTFKVDASKIYVIPNAVHFDSIPDESLPPSNRTLAIGRLEKQKNLFNAISAAAMTSTGLDILGEGSLKKDLQRFAEETKADVQFFDRVPHHEILKKIQQSSFCLLSSLYEGSPKVLLEMMACGKAVVATRVSGIEEIIQSGITGILTGTSAEEIAQGMRPMIQSPELCREMGDRARRYAKEHFSLEVLKDREYQLYQSLIEKKDLAVAL